MALINKWRDVAYNEKMDREQLQRLWTAYFQQEKEIYAQLLKNPDEKVEGTVKELADKYGVSVMTMTGFLDGINDRRFFYLCCKLYADYLPRSDTFYS